MNFNDLCKTVESLDTAEYAAVIATKAAKVIPALRKIGDSKTDCVAMLAMFLTASVYADGKLDEAEYLLLMPALKLTFGADFDFGQAKALVRAFKPEGREIKKLTNDIIDLIGSVDEELKGDLIILCLLVCAIDGKISLREKRYIKQLIR